MKRDMDIVRRIALEAADLQYDQVLTGLDGIDPMVFGMHAIWMKQAGLIEASIEELPSRKPPTTRVFRLTWDGCEFADAVCSDTLWAKAKSNVFRPGISFTFDVLKDWLKTEIAQGLPALRALGN